MHQLRAPGIAVARLVYGVATADSAVHCMCNASQLLTSGLLVLNIEQSLVLVIIAKTNHGNFYICWVLFGLVP